MIGVTMGMVDNVLKLVDAGFTASQISAMMGEPKAEEPKAEEPKAEEPKAEEPKAEEPKAEEQGGEVAKLAEEVAALKNALHAANVAKSEQPAKETADDILASIVKGF